MGWIIAVVVILLVLAFYLENRNKTYDIVRKQVDTRYVTVTKDESGGVFTRFDLTFQDSQSGEPYYIVVDVETTGRYKYRNPDRSHLSNWPRIVQIAWSVFDKHGGLIKDVGKYFKQPRPIPLEAVSRHGITDEICREKGVDPVPVLTEFLEDCEDAMYLVGHNIEFDYDVIEANMRRYKISEDFYISTICTMHSTTNLLRLPPAVKGTLYKYPSLDELVRYLFYGKGIFPERRSHDAEFDVAYTARCFFELKERGVIKK